MQAQDTYQNMIEKAPIINISDVLEYLFCPRFIYYIYCLDIPQHEEKRFKVQKGRKVHETKRINNPEYLRKKLGVVRRETSVFLASKTHHIKGIVDEVLFLEDNTAAPLEYKFAQYKNKIFKTYKHQLALQAMMIQENYNTKVNKGYICYTRSNNLIKQTEIKTSDFEKSTQTIDEILQIIEKGYYPNRTKHKNKCTDCCYRNICI